MANTGPIVCLGELLIDFVPDVNGCSLAEAPGFLKAPGGAPGNVAVGVRRLGRPSGFLGKVGADPFGDFLANVLANEGVDIGGLTRTRAAKTALAFVTLKADGEREFSFYRDPSADMLYRPEDVDRDRVRAASVLHYGSISLISAPSREATLTAVATAVEAGVRVSCDPNLREALWPSREAARDGLRSAIAHASIVKISDYEVEFLCGTGDMESRARSLWHDGMELMAVTLGADGAMILSADSRVDVPGFTVAAVDTTGAGDGFTAGLLTGLSMIETPIAELETDRLFQIARRANAVGALATTKRGAIPALPTGTQVDEFLNGNS